MTVRRPSPVPSDRAEYARLLSVIQTVPGRFAGGLPREERERFVRLHAMYGPRPERTNVLQGMV